MLCRFSHYPGNGKIFAEILPGAGQLGELYNQFQTGVIDIISPLASGTLHVTSISDPNAAAWQIPFVSGETTVTLYPRYYNLQLYDQFGRFFDQGNFTVSAGQTLHLQTPFGPTTHNIATINAASAKTVFGEGFNASINVTVANQGSYPETFNVTVYANDTQVATQPVTLETGTSTTITFTWNTTGFAYGNCTIDAYAEPVLNETYVADNNITWTVHVGVPGDISGPTQGVYDGKCDMRDVSYLIIRFNSKPYSANWNPNADINDDGTVNMRDISTAIINFNKHE